MTSPHNIFRWLSLLAIAHAFTYFEEEGAHYHYFRVLQCVFS